MMRRNIFSSSPASSIYIPFVFYSSSTSSLRFASSSPSIIKKRSSLSSTSASSKASSSSQQQFLKINFAKSQREVEDPDFYDSYAEIENAEEQDLLFAESSFSATKEKIKKGGLVGGQHDAGSKNAVTTQNYYDDEKAKNIREGETAASFTRLATSAQQQHQRQNQRFFDLRRQSTYFDDLLDEQNPHAQNNLVDSSGPTVSGLGKRGWKKQDFITNSKNNNNNNNNNQLTSDGKNNSESDKASSSSSHLLQQQKTKRTKLRSVSEGEIFSDRNAFFENPEESSKLLAKVIEEKRKKLENHHQKSASTLFVFEQLVEPPSDPTVATVIDCLKEALLRMPPSSTSSSLQSPTAATTTAETSPGNAADTIKQTDTETEKSSGKENTEQQLQQQQQPPKEYIRIQDLKEKMKQRKLFAQDGGPLPDKTSILRFLKQYTDKYFDVTGNGLYVAPFGTFSLADKVQPDFNPSSSSGTSLSSDDDFEKYLEKKAAQREKENLNGKNAADGENGGIVDLLGGAEPEEWDIELDLDTDEQAETNRTVQESVELEELEELEEAGKLDKVLAKQSFFAKSKSTSITGNNNNKKRSAEIFKQFASEVSVIPSAPQLTPAQSLGVVHVSSSSSDPSNTQNRGQQQQLSIADILAQHYSKLAANQTSASSVTVAMAPPLPTKFASPSLPKKTTPPTLHQQTQQQQRTPTGVLPGWGSAMHSSGLHQQHTPPSSSSPQTSYFSSTSSSIHLQSKSLAEMLDLFVEVVPASFFVPVMLLRFSDDLRRATGNRDVGRVIRQYHFFFDFKSAAAAASSDGGDNNNTNIQSAATSSTTSLKNLQVKLKLGTEHPRLGVADELYNWANPNINNNNNISNNTPPPPVTPTSSSSSQQNSNNNSGVISPDTLERLQQMKSSSSSSMNTVIMPSYETPRIAPIRLATDDVDADSQMIMSSLNAIANEKRKNSNSSDGLVLSSPSSLLFSATIDELVKVLVKEAENSKVVPEYFKTATSLLQWLLQRPRMFLVTKNESDDKSSFSCCCWKVSLRPLDVAPSSLNTFELDASKKTEIEEFLAKEVVAVSENNNEAVVSVEALLDISGKIRPGMWMELNPTLKKKLNPETTKGGKLLANADNLKSPKSFSNEEEMNKSASAGVPPIVQWLRLFGKTIWVDVATAASTKKSGKSTSTTSTAAIKLRKFTGTADLDDVEHFAIGVLHAQVKQMVKEKKVMDLDMKGEVLKELPECVANLFEQNEETTFKVLKAHTNKFAVSKKEDSGCLMIGLASLFRK